MLNGISLFTGYAGIDLALKEHVRPIMYCEIEKYAQGILLSRMDEGSIPFAPIWNDVTTLDGRKFKGMVDIVYGGFPCQDISVAGKAVGLEGKRSGLFFEIVRIAREANPTFLFLENVPAIRTRGAFEVQRELASIGHDTRWTTLSASEVGANHKRERWFCLATNTKIKHDRRTFSSKVLRQVQQFRISSIETDVANSLCEGLEGQRKPEQIQEKFTGPYGICNFKRKATHANSKGLFRQANASKKENNEGVGQSDRWAMPSASDSGWWQAEPSIRRVDDGTPFRMDRIKALGNGVVPLQAKIAFDLLMGYR